MKTEGMIEKVIIGIALIFIIKIYLFPIEVVDSTDKKVAELNTKIADLQKQNTKIADLQKQIPLTPPNYTIPIMFGSIIISASAIAITFLIINYKGNK